MSAQQTHLPAAGRGGFAASLVDGVALGCSPSSCCSV